MAINPFEPPRASSYGTVTRDRWLLKMVISVAMFSLLHLVAFIAIGLLCGFVFNNTSPWLCKIVVQMLSIVISLPLVAPILIAKAGTIPAPLLVANSVFWGIGLHGLREWIYRRRRHGDDRSL